MQRIKVTVNGTEYAATLEANAAARAFAERLPRTLVMSELNGNEKYCYVDEALPTAARRPSTIHAGDIMLYGDECIVLFYKTFHTRYSYTKLGHLDDPADIAVTVGAGSVTVVWERA